MAPILVHSGVGGGLLGRLGRPVGSRAPPLRSRTPILSDLGSQLGVQRLPKWSPNGEKICPKIDAKIDVILCDLLSDVGRLSGCFWDPGPSKMSVSCKRGAHFQKFVFFMLGMIY